MAAVDTITRAHLVDAVHRRLGLSRAECKTLVEFVLAEMSDALVRGENVKLSSFGSFLVRAKGRRIGRNPNTGVEVPIEPRRVVTFKASNLLKARLGIEDVADDTAAEEQPAASRAA